MKRLTILSLTMLLGSLALSYAAIHFYPHPESPHIELTDDSCISGPRVSPIPYDLNLTEVDTDPAEVEVTTSPAEQYPINQFDEPLTRWVSAWKLNYRIEPSTASDDTIVGLLDRGTSLLVIGEVIDSPWVMIEIDGNYYFCHSEFLSDTEIIINTVWSGENGSLTSRQGKIAGPSGNETFYNLDMSGCVQRMHNLGYNGDYWVREDGVKMLGPYIMVAADFSQRPLGTVLECSLGTAIVVDTGEFVSWDPTRLDVAVTW